MKDAKRNAIEMRKKAVMVVVWIESMFEFGGCFYHLLVFSIVFHELYSRKNEKRNAHNQNHINGIKS